MASADADPADSLGLAGTGLNLPRQHESNGGSLIGSPTSSDTVSARSWRFKPASASPEAEETGSQWEPDPPVETEIDELSASGATTVSYQGGRRQQEEARWSTARQEAARRRSRT